MSDLTRIAPPSHLSEAQRRAVFEKVFRHLAAYRNTSELYAVAEYSLSTLPDDEKEDIRRLFVIQVTQWGQDLLKHIWMACSEPGEGAPPILGPLCDTSLVGLPPMLVGPEVAQVLTTALFLDIISRKTYSARTRCFLSSFAPLDEAAIAAVLKDPKHAVQEAEKKMKSAKKEASEQSKTLRNIGIGLGAVAGGVLIGVSGGLAAPLVGAAVSTVLGWLGVGGTAAGLLASGLASSSAVCGALFGAYGSKKTAETVGRYLREVNDLAVVPVRQPCSTLAVRLCVSGWLDSPEDVVAPWTVFDGDDTFALQWEVDALENLSNAFNDLIKAQAMYYVKAEIVKRTVFAALFAALSPTAWLQVTRIIDNPWMTAKSLATKAGKVLGKLLAERVLGNRAVTLVGYSLGSMVIFEALQFLATLPPSQTCHLIQDVYLFGAPVSSDEVSWTAVRRVVAGRLVNGYSSNDYILAVLSRVSNMSWGVAGLVPVSVKGVENVSCASVDGHLKWRSMVGQCLQSCSAPGIVGREVQKQIDERDKKAEADMDLCDLNVQEILREEPAA
ncbi:DUF726-domain-containing protein [Laetiporus sulphureus 93-53]|uniref:DUF726-domain-containing protein n=1 Tax=Laetiporus sulphureus 93-53 TaxID=1314785 RepID=A0A165H7I1_9APHY|nr:DUF726-domain-containing protein [Laetiporus sulphureus 93-53]KZT11351.1 DUF726-domain-containing protein [Laetiporus sulphureus 93-53]